MEQNKGGLKIPINLILLDIIRAILMALGLIKWLMALKLFLRNTCLMIMVGRLF